MRWRRVVAAVGVAGAVSRVAGMADDVRPARADDGVVEDWRGEPAVRPGDEGVAVTRWQDDLNEWLAATRSDLGPIRVDGVFGPETEAATRRFQDHEPTVPTDLVVDDEDRRVVGEARG